MDSTRDSRADEWTGALLELERVVAEEFKGTQAVIYTGKNVWILLSVAVSLRKNGTKKDGSMGRSKMLKQVFKNEYLAPISGGYQVRKWTGHVPVPDVYVRLQHALYGDKPVSKITWKKLRGEWKHEIMVAVSKDARKLREREQLCNLSTMTRRIGLRMSALGVLGVSISLYAIHVKQQKLLLEEDYQALCDSESFSCSLVLTSEYSSLLSYWSLVDKYSALDWSNAHLGVVVYTLFALYPVARLMPYHAHFYVFVSVCAAVVMMYLAYVLVFVLHDLCLVCVATYVVTTTLAWNSLALLGTKRRVQRLTQTMKSDCMRDAPSVMHAARFS